MVLEPGYLGGDGWEKLWRRIQAAIEEDGFLFVLVIGERGKGKSSLALNIGLRVYGDPGLVEKALAFTVSDIDMIVEREKGLRAPDGRVKMIIWDDIGIHFSTYRWFMPHERHRMTSFIENFQAIREDVAVIIGTVVEPEMLPPKLRVAANAMVDLERRGYAKLMGYKRIMWMRTWRTVGDIVWGPAPEDLYARYRRLKRLAHQARRRSRTLGLAKLAKLYAKILVALEDYDFETLYGFGIVDKSGRVTPFGKLVLQEAGLKPEALKVVKNESW